MTERGAAPNPDDLAAYDEKPVRAGTSRVSSERNDHPALSPDEQELLRRLQEWRRDRAGRDGVPAYVVAPNAALTEIAQRRPADSGELVEVNGFGPTRVEKYGGEILNLLAELNTSDSPD